jgi:hypothetical protein
MKRQPEPKRNNLKLKLDSRKKSKGRKKREWLRKRECLRRLKRKTEKTN